MSSMIETVARALCAKHYSDRFKKPVDDPHVVKNVDGNWNGFADEACTAIGAMRRPTIKMLRASDNVVLNEEEIHAGPYELAKAEWQAMIDAALKEEGE